MDEAWDVIDAYVYVAPDDAAVAVLAPPGDAVTEPTDVRQLLDAQDLLPRAIGLRTPTGLGEQARMDDPHP